MPYLHTQELGRSTSTQKQRLVLLHGWGMNSQIWGQKLLSEWESDYQITLIDLPGHGRNQDFAMGDMAQLIAHLKPHIPEQSILMGWSLGGLIAQAFALAYPKQVKRVLLVASSPCFMQRDDWSCATPAVLLDKFASNLQDDYLGTLRRFLNLQFLGVKNGTRLAKHYFQQVTQEPVDIEALYDGLMLLKNTDLRLKLDTLDIPLRWILGQHDRLVPSVLAEELPALSVDNKVAVLEGSCHVPFITHPEVFKQQLALFLSD